MSAISRLMIEQQFAAIGIKTTNAQLHISTPRPQMQIETVASEMTIDRKNPSFEVDWEQVRAESGLVQPVRLARQLGSKAYAKGMESIAKSSRDGDHLGSVERGGDRVVDLARQQVMDNPQTDINVGLMPKSSPNVTWDPGYVNISWSRHKLIVEWDTEFMPEFVVDPPYSIEIFLRQQPSIKISLAEGDAPYDPGKVVDISL